MSKVDLKVDWATHKAAEYACKHWHYSRKMPVFGSVKIGAWENDVFIGVVLFSRGATPEIGSPYGLCKTEVCELTRVALKSHISNVSQIIAKAFKFFKKKCPRIRLIVSFADSAQGHHGGIYQATNWIYAGESKTHAYYVLGKVEHPKTLHSRYGIGGQSIPWLIKNIDPNAKRIFAGVKHRYLMPLDRKMRKQILPLAKPYPKRPAEGSNDGSTIARRFDSDPDAPNNQGESR